MKKIMAGLLVAGACFGMALPSVVNAADVNGEGSADVTVNGTIGMDNTDPTSPIEEGNDSWINVTLDTTTIFYNVAGQTTIESPTYNIENKSGRPVDVSVHSFTQTNSADISKIDSLELASRRSDTATTADTKTPLFTGPGSTIETLGTPTKILTLANNEGKMNETDSSTDTNLAKATFGYVGTVASDATVSEPIFQMTLQLDVPNTWN